MGGAFRGVSVLSQWELQTRGRWAWLPLPHSAVPAAARFCSISESQDSRYRTEALLWRHLTNVPMKRRQQRCGSLTRCFSTCCASFGKLPNRFLFFCALVVWSRFPKETARCREHIKWRPGRREDFSSSSAVLLSCTFSRQKGRGYAYAARCPPRWTSMERLSRVLSRSCRSDLRRPRQRR